MKKKIFLILLLIFIFSGCKTQEEIMQEKEKERVDQISKEVEENKEIPQETKEWIIDNKSKKVLTILCIKSSKKCQNIKQNINVFNNNIKTYYIELDDTFENVKDVYKNTYELDNYTGYLPYAFYVNNDILIDKIANINNIEDINNFLIKNKIVSN